MKIPRINIYLRILHFIKCLFEDHDRAKINLESELKKKLNKKFIFFTGMCRSSFLFVVEFLKIKYPEKNEIVMCSYNLEEMVEIALKKNFKIKLLDIDPSDGVMKIDTIKENLNNNTACVVFTNMFNDSKILVEIRNLCKSKNIMFVEDNAIYLGNFTNKRGQTDYAGSFGDVSLLSFGIMKNFSAFYGGACLTSDIELAEYLDGKVKKLKNFNNYLYVKQIILFFILKILLSKYIYNMFFFYLLKYSEINKIKFVQKLVYPALKFKRKAKIPDNYYSKISSLSISIIKTYLLDDKTLKKDKIRKNNNKLYYELLSQNENLKLIKINDENFQNFLDFPIITKNKKKIVEYLLNNGLEVRTHFYSNCEFLIDQRSNLNSQKFEENIICLPSHHMITNEIVLKYCDTINKFFNKK